MQIKRSQPLIFCFLLSFFPFFPFSLFFFFFFFFFTLLFPVLFLTLLLNLSGLSSRGRGDYCWLEMCTDLRDTWKCPKWKEQ